MELSNGTQIGPYVVQTPLGRGGVAVVYRVQHLTLGTTHALKVLAVPSPSAKERLLAEGRIQASLRHPNVVSVRDVLQVAGAPALLLDFVDGPTLAALIQAELRDLPLVDALGAGVLRGVAAAHRIGLVHRDLKPANVLVAVDDGVLTPRVTDFGLARWMAPDDPRLTRSGASLGTPRYMSPEQIRDPRSADLRSDVWSLGALLYELCCGIPPFAGEDQLELFQAIDAGRFLPLEARREDLPQRFYDAVQAALQRDPADRPQDAGALSEIWGDAVGPLPVDPKLRELLGSLTPTWVKTGETPEPVDARTFGLDDLSAMTAPGEALVPALPDPPPTEAAPAAEGARRWALLPWVLLGILAAALGSLWWASPGPSGELQAAVIDAIEAEPVAPVEPKDAPDPSPTPEDHRRALLVKATEALMDARFAEAREQVSYILAGAEDDRPHRVYALAAWAEGQQLSALEELEKGARRAGEGAASERWLQSFIEPQALDDWLADHPDDSLSRAFRLLVAPPGDPTQMQRDLAALREAWPGRGLPLLATARQARLSGELDRAQEALERWEAADPEVVPLAMEATRLALARGEVGEALEWLDPLVSGERVPPQAWSLRMEANILAGREVALARDLEHGRRGAVDRRLQQHAARMDAWLQRGDRGKAWAAFDEVDTLMSRYSGDPRVSWLWVGLLTEGARLAGLQGDRARLEGVLTRLRSAAEGEQPAWAQAEATRRVLAVEGLLALARGEEGAARQRLAALQEEGASHGSWAPLAEALRGDGVERFRLAPVP